MKRAALALLFLTTGILAACGRVERRVRIAVLSDLTGPRSAYGEGIRRAATLALEDRRDTLLAAGWKVDLAAFDANLSPSDWDAAVRRIAGEPDIFCAVIHADSTGDFSAADILHSAGMVHILPAETASLPDPASRPETIFLSPDDRTHGTSDAQWALSHAAARILVTTDSNVHAFTIGEEFRGRAQAGESTVYTFRILSAQDLAEWSSSYTSIHPDLVYFSGSSQLALSILDRMNASGFPGSLLFAQDDPEDPLPATFASESVTLMFSPASADSAGAAGNPAPMEKYRAAYGADPPAIAALGYDAAAFCLSFLLKKNAGDLNPSSARSWVLDQLRSGVTFQGITGVYNFPQGRPCGIPAYLRGPNPESGWTPAPAVRPTPGATPGC